MGLKLIVRVRSSWKRGKRRVTKESRGKAQQQRIRDNTSRSGHLSRKDLGSILVKDTSQFPLQRRRTLIVIKIGEQAAAHTWNGEPGQPQVGKEHAMSGIAGR